MGFFMAIYNKEIYKYIKLYLQIYNINNIIKLYIYFIFADF